MRREAKVMVRARAEEIARWDAAADADGRSRSDWMRRACDAAAKESAMSERKVAECWSAKWAQESEYERTVTARVRSDRGDDGTILVCVGIPESERGTWDASGRGPGMEDVWPAGPDRDSWCPAWADPTDALDFARRYALDAWVAE
jgi:hypothetical protein